jgi:hypothetical protein
MTVICTRHVFPPIPLRDYDWCAWDEQHNPGAEYPHMVGWGKTQDDAIEDLLRLLDEQAEAADPDLRIIPETTPKGLLK